VFITPWISVMVTMSPLAMCATSWPMTSLDLDAGLLRKALGRLHQPAVGGIGRAVTSCSRVVHLAIGLLISSEMKAPPKPITSAKPSSEVRFRPLAVRKRFSPSRLATMPSTATTAMLVSRNRMMRFMVLHKKSGRLSELDGSHGGGPAILQAAPDKARNAVY
jgi:hypothetical protein